MKQAGARRILLTGAGGFIGAAVTERLAADGHAVVALCRDVEKGRRRLKGIGNAVAIIPWNMSEPVRCGENVDAIIHAAGQGDPASYAARPAETMRDNVLGCVNILDFAATRRVKKVVLVSSGEAYGIIQTNGRIGETACGTVDPLSPRSAYPLCKMAAESLCLAYGREHGIDVSIARLCHVYGPGIAPSDARIAAAFPLSAAQGRNIVMKSAGEQTRSLCYITDAAAGIAAVLFRGRAGETYNVADAGTELTVREFAERVAAAGGVNVIFEAPAASEKPVFNPMPRATFSTGKLQALGWLPQVNLDAGIRATLEYFRGAPV